MLFSDGQCIYLYRRFLHDDNLTIWGINWVSSLRIKQRKGFNGIGEIEAAGALIKKKY